MTIIKIKGGHRIDRDWPNGNGIFLTDDSGERWQVDVSRDITYDDAVFNIPLIGGFSTPACAEEVFVVVQMSHQTIRVGSRRFWVAQVF